MSKRIINVPLVDKVWRGECGDTFWIEESGTTSEDMWANMLGEKRRMSTNTTKPSGAPSGWMPSDITPWRSHENKPPAPENKPPEFETVAHFIARREQELLNHLEALHRQIAASEAEIADIRRARAALDHAK
jgi:hypothetical protein